MHFSFKAIFNLKSQILKDAGLVFQIVVKCYYTKHTKKTQESNECFAQCFCSELLSWSS